MAKQATQPSSDQTPSRAFYPPTALLVEESEIWGNVVSRYLSARGVDVTWLRSPEEAFPFILDVEPDLILIDASIRHSESTLVDRVARLGPDATLRAIVLVDDSTPPSPHPSGMPTARKSDLFAIGSWVDQKIGIFPASNSRSRA